VLERLHDLGKCVRRQLVIMIELDQYRPARQRRRVPLDLANPAAAALQRGDRQTRLDLRDLIDPAQRGALIVRVVDHDPFPVIVALMQQGSVGALKRSPVRHVGVVIETSGGCGPTAPSSWARARCRNRQKTMAPARSSSADEGAADAKCSQRCRTS
jgi:hypothetical protein